MPAKTKSIRAIVIVSQILLLSLLGFMLLRHSSHVKAAGMITVTSKANIVADDGVCTLREAVESANSDASSGATPGECVAGSGTDTINFAITGLADFTNGGQDGYIIPLPTTASITEPVIINGYSQAGAQANTAIAPNPFNGTLLIEIDGQHVNGRLFNFTSNSGGSVIKGLSMYGSDEIAIGLDAPAVEVKGNYIGADATGLVDKGNCVGLAGSNGGGSSSHISAGALIGGLNPEDRNVISGNSRNVCGFPSGAYPDQGWVIRGNYIGVAADGVTAMPNSKVGGSGGFSIDNASDVIVGGTATGSANVISGNNHQGLAPDVADNIQIQGNFIGTDYTGTVAVPNAIGINLTNSANALVGGTTSAARNIVSGNGQGIYVEYNTGMTIQGNYIGTDVTGLLPLGNDATAIGAGAGMTGLLIGGTTSAERNIISANGTQAIYLTSNTQTTIRGNYIGVSADLSVLSNGGDGIVAQDSTGIIGGTGVNDTNIIANSSTAAGVVVTGSSTMSILSNSIYDNNGIGIDLGGLGQTPNDAGDVDSGPNNYLNYPENLYLEESGGNTSFEYNLDVPAGSYRIEFYSNTTADGSGYGEGQTFIGSATVTKSGSSAQAFTSTVTGTGHTNMSATATLVDNSTDGFGATSEFSASATPKPPVVDVSLTKTLLNPNDIAVGATANYGLTLTNNGWSDLDLTAYSNVLMGEPLFADYAPPELAAAGYLADGPIPGTTFVDGGNPDLTCLNGGPGSAGAFYGLTTYADYSVVLCWYSGAETVLPAGDSIASTLDFTIANDSDLVFSNYAMAAVPADDPDSVAYTQITGTADDNLEELIANSQTASPINNFAAAVYPEPVTTPIIDVPAILPKVGIAGGILTILVAGATAVGFGLRQRRLKS